ncbi:MAG: hypothetical protein QM769_12075 [Pseudoxanthomonas sp.]
MKVTTNTANTDNPFASFITREEFAKNAGITYRTAELWAHARKGPKVTIIGGRACYHVDDITAWLDGLRKGGVKRAQKREAA